MSTRHTSNPGLAARRPHGRARRRRVCAASTSRTTGPGPTRPPSAPGSTRLRGRGRAAGGVLRRQRREFDLPLQPAGDAYQHRVWDLMAAIPYGQTRSPTASWPARSATASPAQEVGGRGRPQPAVHHRAAATGWSARTGKLTGYAGRPGPQAAPAGPGAPASASAAWQCSRSEPPTTGSCAVRARRGRARRRRCCGSAAPCSAGRRRRRLVGDVPGRAAGLPGPAGRRQRRGLAGHDRAPQGDRRHPGRGPPARSRPTQAARARRPRRRPTGRDADLRDALARAARQAAPGRRLPLPRRAAVRRGRRHPRRHHRRRPPRRRRRHRHPPPHLPARTDGRRHHDEHRRPDPRPAPAYADDRRRPAPAARPAGRRGAQAEGILDVAYRTVDTPGRAAAAGRHRRSGLVRVAFAGEDHDAVLQALADRISPRILHAPARLDAGRPRARRVLRRPPPGVRPAAGLAAVARVPRSRAAPPAATSATGTPPATPRSPRLAGNPKAVRAVGTACATNPLPVVVPCHRVVRSDGSHRAATSAAPTPSAPCSTLEAA